MHVRAFPAPCLCQAAALDVARFRHSAASLELSNDGVTAALSYLDQVVRECEEAVVTHGPAALDIPAASAGLLSVVPRLVASAWTCKHTPEQQVVTHTLFCRVLTLAVRLLPVIERCPPLFTCLHLLLGTCPCMLHRVCPLGGSGPLDSPHP